MATLKYVNRTAKKVLDQLTAGLDEPGAQRKIDTRPGYVPVVVEYVDDTYMGPVFSVTHYGESNGDAMADPDMTFLRAGHGDYYPLTYRNDWINTNDEGARINGDKTLTFYPRLQASITSFAGTWMQNIKHQQDLKQFALERMAFVEVAG